MMEEPSARRRWTEEETILALYLYFQLPFGRLHSGNPEIKELAQSLGRSSNSVAMKLVNFASLDPKTRDSGRKGLSETSKLDRQVYDRFASNWDGLVQLSESYSGKCVEAARTDEQERKVKDLRSEFRFKPYEGKSVTQTLVSQRVGQSFFRRAVMANFGEVCCITGIAEPQLLVASHIKPWGIDADNRHNPTNGLLLSATMDKAFDRGLITVSPEGRLIVSRQLAASDSTETRDYFCTYENAEIRAARRFDPDPLFLEWHNRYCFVDAASP